MLSFNKKTTKTQHNEPNRATPLITAAKPRSVITEEFRTLRTNINFSSVDKKIQSLMVTSAGRNAGKSTISTNLAKVFAEADDNVLIVDADLRKATLHRTFDLPNTKGLSTVLSEDVVLEDMIQYIPSLNLSVLTSGPTPPNPAELLGSERMANLMGLLEERYSTVIYDVPPVLPVTDAQILSSRVDGVILVVPHGVAQKEELLKSKELLELAHANILGAVFNLVETKGDEAYYGYYGTDEE